jgi:hypothetical protein
MSRPAATSKSFGRGAAYHDSGQQRRKIKSEEKMNGDPPTMRYAAIAPAYGTACCAANAAQPFVPAREECSLR